MGSIFSKPKAVDQGAVMAAQEAAAKKERERLATEQALIDAGAEDKALAAMKEGESKRRAFAGSLTKEGESTDRKRFLKAI